ncbi:MAG: hypothetical protein QNJ44_24060 [Rhodobacter sp.]|nr:hypothetical protein [Rhodobacter sp.]
MPRCDRSERFVEIIYPEDAGPGRRRSSDRVIPLREVSLFLLALVTIKVLLMAGLGGAAYGAKMASLSQGDPIERLASYAMRPDPVSGWIVDQVRLR